MAASAVPEPVPGCAWTLVRPAGVDVEAFRDELLSELPTALRPLVPSIRALSVTSREPDAFCSATLAGAPVDAVVELSFTDAAQRLDPVTAELARRSAAIQGWRLSPTVVFDAARPVPLGAPSAELVSLVFVQRLDGTDAGHFDREWFRHAGLPPEGPQATLGHAARERLEEDGGTTRYVQNRVVEPITPVEWVVHGYSRLHAPWLVPELPDTPYERFRGEEPFDRWPPRLVQGREHGLV
jgi:hypothetical protein